jgi:uncharacterized protein YvpB/LysM repeat protein
MNRIYKLLISLVLVAAFPWTARASTIPDSAYIPGVTGHAQGHSLSCEARSAVDWAAYWGVSISESEFLANLPRSDNPDAGFVGDPDAAWGRIPPQSYGVHAKPVAALLREYGFEAEAHKKLAWDEVRTEVAAGRPVIVWIIGQMWTGTPISYTASEGHTTTVAYFEHTMILVGYGPDYVYVVDAYTGVLQTYTLNTFLASWDVLGDMAVFGSLEKAASQSTPTARGETYIVQPGEFLVQLAERFGTTWQELAVLNGIAYPYTIYPGQKLALPAKPVVGPEPQPTATPQAPPAQAEESFTLRLPLVYRQAHFPATHQPLPDPYNPTAPPDTYIAQPGDTLLIVALRLGIYWRDLAALNAIEYPFILQPGQILRLK